MNQLSDKQRLDSDPNPEATAKEPKIQLLFQTFKNKSLRLSAYWEAFSLAIESLRTNKLRTALTLIGIVVGVASVISVVTIIKGLDHTVANTFSSQGSTVFTISKRPRFVLSREDFIKFNKRKDITREDADAITRQCTACWRTGVSSSSLTIAKHADKTAENVTMRGITTSVFTIENINLDAGRAWTEVESSAGHEVGVIGADVLDNVYGGASPDTVIGRDIYLSGKRFRVIGVAERLGKIFGLPRDNFVLVPYQAYRKVSPRRQSLSIMIQVPTPQQLETAQDQARTILRAIRGKTFADEDDGFSLQTEDVFLDFYRNATSNIYIVIIGVAAISLIVGGIVVMNIMLVSVTERTREIGIRKAIGARRNDILSQFLIEAITITAIGGLVGVVVGFMLAYVISKLLGFPLLISTGSAILGVTVSAIVGIVSGSWPAWRAATLNPIEALRSE
jgi:putative ABC transport system permease protein